MNRNPRFCCPFCRCETMSRSRSRRLQEWSEARRGARQTISRGARSRTPRPRKAMRISGGKRQRAALDARGTEPGCCCWRTDQRARHWDDQTTGKVVRRIVHEQNCAGVIASYNLGFVESFCDDMVILRGGILGGPVRTADVDWNQMITELLNVSLRSESAASSAGKSIERNPALVNAGSPYHPPLTQIVVGHHGPCRTLREQIEATQGNRLALHAQVEQNRCEPPCGRGEHSAAAIGHTLQRTTC